MLALVTILPAEWQGHWVGEGVCITPVLGRGAWWEGQGTGQLSGRFQRSVTCLGT